MPSEAAEYAPPLTGKFATPPEPKNPAPVIDEPLRKTSVDPFVPKDTFAAEGVPASDVAIKLSAVDVLVNELDRPVYPPVAATTPEKFPLLPETLPVTVKAPPEVSDISVVPLPARYHPAEVTDDPPRNIIEVAFVPRLTFPAPGMLSPPATNAAFVALNDPHTNVDVQLTVKFPPVSEYTDQSVSAAALPFQLDDARPSFIEG